jgi:uncharacterized membrane protein YjjP (DUF1212 family)
VKIEYKIDLGHLITFILMFAGFLVQYGATSQRLSACESQGAKTAASIEQLTTTLNTLHDTIIQVQVQIDEREKRWAVELASAELQEGRRQVHMAGVR